MSEDVAARQATDAMSSGTILIVTTCWWSSLARLAHLLVTSGSHVAVLCPRGHAARAVPGATVFEQQAFRPLQALSRAIATCRPTMIVPGDDRAVTHLHQLHRHGSERERALVERSLGSPDSYPIVSSRVRLIALARDLGIAVPDDRALATPAELDEWLARVPSPWVVKVDGAWAGKGVRIATTPQQARRAFRRFPKGPSIWAAVKRAIVNRDPYALADRRRHRTLEMSAQRHVDGWPGNLAMFCRDGEVLAATVVEAVACWGETGPSIIVRLVDRPEFVADAARLARTLGLSGFYGLDFMVEQSTGRAVLIEMNPRATALCNIRLAPDSDLIGAAAGLDSDAVRGPSAAPLAGSMIAHFPLAWHWSPSDPRLASCFQDIPRDAPALMAEMLRPSWPDRPVAARMAAWTQRTGQAWFRKFGPPSWNGKAERKPGGVEAGAQSGWSGANLGKLLAGELGDVERTS